MKPDASSQTPGQPRKHRCFACGEPFDPSLVSECPLCGFRTDTGTSAGKDLTPYAAAHDSGQRGWIAMGEWVWFASAGRLQHLALMKSSTASRRYARGNRCLLAMGLALLLATTTGWRTIAKSPAISPQREPQGQGWFRMVATEPTELEPLPEGSPVALWWNPIQALFALVGGLVVSWLLLLSVEGVMRGAVTRAHPRRMRAERRMTAALNYATAWWLPVTVGLLLAACAPIAAVGDVARWPYCPTRSAFVLSGSVAVSFGGVLWWFWLVRMGMTAPARIRAKVVSVMAMGTAAVVGAAGAIWWVGLPRGLDLVIAACDLVF